MPQSNRPVFNVGDRVIVTGGTYRITTPGSYGVIGATNVSSSSISFDFFSIPGYYNSIREENQYTVEHNCLQSLNLFLAEHGLFNHTEEELQEWLNTNQILYVNLSSPPPAFTTRDLVSSYYSKTETIAQTIDRLHKRQYFYKIHKSSLPSWSK